ncbi:GntR family transcriptional regulator [Caballeronia sp. SEWSISQ10-4 2]|uniref:GntR family transcriptional regulator n=1 Tax=Caballeronia sp. SEWSISQ10-4 2 TaxID=2937438 RepID=UPI0026534FAC|nr:GntR family transcriptional regulator [Caballeronia sp. SEWSISQ10-4 2]MDN7180622.1 GntR family transcriptional regulator [Caballeronia sp. SEWSISQ10-4 2]MDP9024155.1 GntR family transcriptional regulator [Candidatus Eremiobacteraeota bacterium]
MSTPTAYAFTVESDTGAGSERPATLSETVQKALENLIFSGEFKPGERLDEGELAVRFNASRTPVREAFKALEGLGLVEIRGRQGVTVAKLSLPVLIEMFHVMASLEGLCARFAARRATAAQKRALAETHEALTAALKDGDTQRFYDINQIFHDQLYAASNTEYVAEQTRALRKRVAPYRRYVTNQPGRMNATIGEHQRIIDAIAAADAQAAEDAASDHVNLLGDDMVDFIAAISPS